jgi:molybdopterin synthase catalytic subunit
MIQLTDKPISPDRAVAAVKTSGSGCVVTYVGLIRDNSHGKPVLSVEYSDPEGRATAALEGIADDISQRFPVSNVAIFHRIGKINVGDINLVVAVAAAHRGEGFDACRYAIDRFKQSLPTLKKETYRDGTVREGGREE